MTLRLIEMVIPEPAAEDLRHLFVEQPMLEVRQVGLREGEVLVKILLDGEKSEAVLDLLENKYAGQEGYLVGKRTRRKSHALRYRDVGGCC